MTRTMWMSAAVLAVVGSSGAMFCKSSTPKIPAAMGYCVTVEDTTGKFIDVEYVPLHKPDPKKLEEFRGSIMSAVNHIGQRNSRLDIVRASGTVLLGEGDPATAQAGSGGCRTICSCASPVYCTPASGPASSDPTTDAARKPPGDPGGGTICGCSGACGTCEKCTVVCDGK